MNRWWRARSPARRAGYLLATGAVVAAAVVAITGLGGGARHAHMPASARQPSHRPAQRGVSMPHPGFTPHPPAVASQPDTPVQQRYDQAFRRGFSAPSDRKTFAVVEALPEPGPGTGQGWPALPVADSPGVWATEFTTGLLDINFTHQSRAGLGRWLAAQEAPDLMPGVPAAVAGKTLYASLLDPVPLGATSLIPSAAAWLAAAHTGVTWSVSGLRVQVDPQWQSMIDAGWQPHDLRAVVEDVSGVLTVAAHGRAVATHRFSLVLQLGSAAWHAGYGTALASDWKEP